MAAARYVLNACAEEGTPINNWKLQKILYELQRAFYTAFDAPCFEDDFEAWPCGPVVPAVYYAYCTAGASPLYLKSETADVFTGEEKKTADEVIEKRSTLHPCYLERDAKKEGRPWAKVFRGGTGSRAVISKEQIRTGE